MKRLSKIRKIFSYINHYGFVSALALAYEKLFTDKKRFSSGKKGGNRLPSGRSCGTPAERIDFASTIGKRVLYAVHYFYPERRGGTERFTLNLAKEHKRLGGESVVLVLDANLPLSAYPYSYGGILYREYEYDGIRCIGFRHKKAPKGLYYKNVTANDFAMRAFAKFILERENVDLVHATYPQPFVSFLAQCRDEGVPYVVTCTDFAMNCRFATMIDKKGDFCDGSSFGERCAVRCKSCLCTDFGKRYEAAREALASAAAITVPSDFVKDVMIKEFGSLNVQAVNHGIGDEFTEKRKRKGVRRFLYAGTLSPLKGVHLLLSAFARLDGDFELVIVGDGDVGYKSNLASLADERVRFVGALDAEKMPEIYNEADCVVVPSLWYETYNFVLREAASCGALVISADIGAMPEAVREGENGFLFDVGDENSLYSALRCAAEFDFCRYKQLSYPSVADEVKIYESIYESALENKKKLP